jgi:ribosomal protein S18 acetylase RimI-like enzyme
MFEIREGQREEIQKFELYDANNDGESVIVAEQDGEIVGYVQYTGNDIFFMQSEGKGCGRAMIEFLQEGGDIGCERRDELRAINCLPGARGFYEKLGFEKASRSMFGNNPDYLWLWYRDEN